MANREVTTIRTFEYDDQGRVLKEVVTTTEKSSQ